MKLKTMITKVFLLNLLILPTMANASLQGNELSLQWGLPFVGILLSIALCPLIIPNIWHHHFGKITAAWTVLFLLPFSYHFGLISTGELIAHALLTEYLPFIILLFSLFTVSGGILVEGNLHGSAALNTKLLALGTVLASIMGTTGAAMVLIRPLLRANDNRKHRVHVVLFFIMLVANIGGGLTPLGDPPLFLGFLKGVSFGWTVEHMLLPMLLLSLLLLPLFYFVDSYYYRKEDEVIPHDRTPDSSVRLSGIRNIPLLIAVVASVLMSGLWKSDHLVTIFGSDIALPSLLRDVLLIGIAGISLWITPKLIREKNQFNWEPIAEVAKLFIGIFITIAPVIAILQAGMDGKLASLVSLVSDEQGSPINTAYFWMTGLLSAFLDNAPTYLIFFNLASGDAVHLMGPLSQTLLAISAGSVFMGALTYVGNAPNFMVRSIAIQGGVKMPSFFGYMFLSMLVLLPLFLLLSLVFFP